MSDSGLSREFMRRLHKRCVDYLDENLVVYVCRGRPYAVLLVIDKWRAKTLGSILVDRDDWDRAGYHARNRKMSELIRRVAAESAGIVGDPTLPADFCTRFPAIAEFMKSGRYSDGTVRKRSAITIMAGDGDGFKCVLNDPDNLRGVWATARTLDGLFVVLEALVADPKAPWKPSKPTGTRR